MIMNSTGFLGSQACAEVLIATREQAATIGASAIFANLLRFIIDSYGMVCKQMKLLLVSGIQYTEH